MITLEEFITAFIGFVPLYFAMVLVPAMVSQLVLMYSMGAGLVRPATPVRRGPFAIRRLMEISNPAMGGATAFAMTVIVAPFAEELIFRGIPLLIHPVLAWVGTVGWALAHSSIVGAEMQAAALGSPKALLAGIAHAIYFMTSGIFYMLIWSLGFGYGAVAIAYHMMHNALVYLSERGIRIRRERPAPVARPVVPVIPVARPAQTVGRRVLRNESLGTSLYIPPPEGLVAKKFKEES